MSAFQKSAPPLPPKKTKNKTENKWLHPSCCSPTAYMPDSGMGALHLFQLIVACRIHAGASARWLPTSMETFCSVPYSIYRPFILLSKPVTPLLCHTPLPLLQTRFEQTTLTTTLSSSTLLSVGVHKVTVPSMSLGPIPTVDQRWLIILEFQNIFKITCCCIPPIHIIIGVITTFRQTEKAPLADAASGTCVWHNKQLLS